VVPADTTYRKPLELPTLKPARHGLACAKSQAGTLDAQFIASQRQRVKQQLGCKGMRLPARMR
jgi:hypothetical protein